MGNFVSDNFFPWAISLTFGVVTWKVVTIFGCMAELRRGGWVEA